MSSTPMATTYDIRHVWNDMLEIHIKRLNAKEQKWISDARDRLSYSDAVSTADKLAAEARGTGVSNCLLRLKPSLQHLKEFSEGIRTMMQTKADPLCLIWGCVELLLTTAMQFLSIMETMTNMLSSLTKTLTRLNRYILMLPNQVILQQCLHLVCDKYVGFCVSAILFYKKMRWYTIAKVAVIPISQQFKTARQEIENHILDFEKEARIEIDEITVRGLQSPRPVKLSLFNVLYERNTFFTARQNELSDIHDQFQQSTQAGRRGICTIHSMAGMGKTQLALEYAYMYRDEYDCIFWLPAEHGPMLAQVFSGISRSVGITNQVPTSAISMGEAVQKAKDWLEATECRWLLIYDNVDDWDTIKPYWPIGTSGSIIITAQRKELVQVSGGREIPLAPLKYSDGAILLLKHLRIPLDLSSPTFITAKIIARHFGGLPVALSHIAGAIEKSQATLDEFSVSHTAPEESRRMWSQDCRTWTHQYKVTLEETWDIALRHLLAGPRALINVLAMLDAGSISESILFTREVIARHKNLLLRDSIISLGERQLVKREWSSGKPFWSIHRALQQSLLHRLKNDASVLQQSFDTAVDIVRFAFPRQSDIQAPSNDNWLANEACLGHALHLEDVYRNEVLRIRPPEQFADLLSDVGNYMWERGLYERGILTLKLAKEIHEARKASGAAHNLMEHSKICTCLCGIYLELGISGRKEGLDEALNSWRLRDQHRLVLSPNVEDWPQEDCLLIANSWNDIACCMLEYSCYDKVEKWLQKSLELKRTHGLTESGAAVFNYAENFKNLGILRTAQSRHDEAVQLSLKAVQLIEKDNGPDSAVTQSFRFHLAYAFYQAGRLTEAFAEHENVRERRVHIFGDKNVHALNSHYACAVVQQTLGHVEKAEEMLSYCLEAEVNNTWTLDYVARIKFRLAKIWETDGRRPHDAATYIQDARLIRDHHRRYFRKFNVLAGLESEEMVVYDQMIPIEGGRSTVGQLRVSPAEMVEFTRQDGGLADMISE